MNTRLPTKWLALATLVLLAGCGSDRIPVGGAVTFDGRPVPEGSISFEPADGNGPSTGGPIAEGRYELSGEAAPLPGKKIVRISAVRKTGRKIPGGVLSGPPTTTVDEIERYIPAIYNNQSTLTCDVSREASRQIDFHLKSEASQ